MSKLQTYLDSLNVMNSIDDEDVENTITLLKLYAPMVRQSSRRLDEYSMECFEGRRQSISDFINLAIDYDHDADRKRIADRLASMGHSLQLLEILEDALMLVKDDVRYGGIYYRILSARYFNVYCKSNEDAFLQAGISSSTYYRHIRNAQRFYAAMLWCIVIPDLILMGEGSMPPPTHDALGVG